MKAAPLLALAFLAGLAGAWVFTIGTQPLPITPVATKESTYDRVMRTGEIRCAYGVYAPAFMKDPNTGALSGIFYDIMTEVGKRLNVKIHWVEEVGYGVIAEGFVTNRYDAFCTTVWPTAERSRGGSFTIPLYYSPVGVFVRKDDHRFDNDLSKLDDPSIRFAVRDGDISSAFATASFPQAKQVGIPQLSDTSQTLDDVVHRKADATINEPSLLHFYLERNPDSLVDITAGRPLRVSPNTIMLRPNDYQFKTMMDVTLLELLNSGFIEKVLRKYEKSPTFLRVAYPYRGEKGTP